MVLWMTVAATPAAFGWHDEGHTYAARAAVLALPAEGEGAVPAFFREGIDLIAHGSLDPDVIRSRQLPQLRDADAPEHFIDYELLQGKPLPKLRSEYIKLCAELGHSADVVGTLPYAIAERGQWLTMAFAEHRRSPDNPHIKAKCLVLAGILSHYTADLAMPLHTSVHFNGRVPQDETGAYNLKAKKTGIHSKVDALPTKIPYNEIYAAPLPAPSARPDLLGFTIEELAKSHALLDRTYELEAKLPAMAELNLTDAEVKAFTIDRMQHAAAFTAAVFYSAWANSATIEIEPWLDRTVFDEHFDPTKVPPQPAP